MYLKRLQLQGFKSFAARTALDFSPGITAIVGPNGSGKSNVADSLRWVLGEQNMRQLRGKKSEDIIFAGSQSRSALGMAEVTLTLDNSSGWLPSEYTEVTVTRRNYRSGDTEYLINNIKVRLKDVITLLQQARIGHDSYTIIGQGLVDQALSARAEERRGLFEDAAGIKIFQSQRNEAEQRLTLTQTNLGRLHDILNEIEPRLAPLAEQARRAHEYIVTRTELDRALRHWFAIQWSVTTRQIGRAEDLEKAADTRVTGLRTTLSHQDEEQTALRGQRDRLTGTVQDLRRQRGEANGRIQTGERELAVVRERAASVARAEAELGGEQDAVRSSQEESEKQVIDLEVQVQQLGEEIERLEQTLAEAESSQHRSRQQQEREEAKLRAAQRDAMQSQAKVAAVQSDLARLTRQIAERQSGLEQRRQTVAGIEQRAEAARQRLEKVRSEHEAGRSDLGDLLIDREAHQQDIAEMQETVARQKSAIADCQRERRALTDRLALLQEWSTSSGDPSAILTYIANQPGDRQPRILGTIAQLVQARQGFETTIETALGPWLHAIVAASEDGAWQCASLIREAGAGRAAVVWPTAVQRSSDDMALALFFADGSDPMAVQIATTLLEGMQYVHEEDTGALRWQMKQRPIISPRGDMAHPTGWLIAGAGQKASSESTLMRARELRELPERIDTLDEEIGRRSDEAAVSQAMLDRLKGELQRLERDIKEREVKQAESARHLANAQRDAEKIANETQIAAAVAQQLEGELTTLEAELASVENRKSEIESAHRDVTETLVAVQEEVELLLEANRTQQDELSRERTTLAVRRQEFAAVQQRIEAVRIQSRELAKQAARREERLGELHTQQVELTASIARLEQDLEAQRQSAGQIHTQVVAHETALREMDARLAELDKAQAAERVELTQAEAEFRKASLDAQRARDAIELLREQMTEEMDAYEAGLIINGDLLPDDQIPASDELTKFRKQIESLRGRLKSLGGYDPEAPRAYEEQKSRYEFLTSQVRDMEEASARLRAVIIELDQTMRRRFEETFQAVNQRFQQHFVTLFQGGAARLELTQPKRGGARDDEDEEEGLVEEMAVSKKGMTGGVEVFVQIPGKKVQDLTLLSGGERAMVSAALLFALLETNPPPFCLLDEVDAALDESNVVRFCEILQTLATQTQFIVITHNRVTMTHASAIYGVSMTESVSRILSMRLAEAQPA